MSRHSGMPAGDRIKTGAMISLSGGMTTDPLVNADTRQPDVADAAVMWIVCRPTAGSCADQADEANMIVLPPYPAIPQIL